MWIAVGTVAGIIVGLCFGFWLGFAHCMALDALEHDDEEEPLWIG